MPALVMVVAIWVMVVPILPKLLMGAEAARNQLSLAPNPKDPELEVAQAVKRVIDPGEKIYTMDIHDYFLSEAALPTKFFFPSQHLKPSNAAVLNSTPSAEVRKILAQHPSAIIMRRSIKWPSSVVQQVDAYVRDFCHVSATVHGATVYACSSP